MPVNTGILGLDKDADTGVSLDSLLKLRGDIQDRQFQQQRVSIEKGRLADSQRRTTLAADGAVRSAEEFDKTHQTRLDNLALGQRNAAHNETALESLDTDRAAKNSIAGTNIDLRRQELGVARDRTAQQKEDSRLVQRAQDINAAVDVYEMRPSPEGLKSIYRAVGHTDEFIDDLMAGVSQTDTDAIHKNAFRRMAQAESDSAGKSEKEMGLIFGEILADTLEAMNQATFKTRDEIDSAQDSFTDSTKPFFDQVGREADTEEARRQGQNQTTELNLREDHKAGIEDKTPDEPLTPSQEVALFEDQIKADYQSLDSEGVVRVLDPDAIRAIALGTAAAANAPGTLTIQERGEIGRAAAAEASGLPQNPTTLDSLKDLNLRAGLDLAGGEVLPEAKSEILNALTAATNRNNALLKTGSAASVEPRKFFTALRSQIKKHLGLSDGELNAMLRAMQSG